MQNNPGRKLSEVIRLPSISYNALDLWEKQITLANVSVNCSFHKMVNLVTSVMWTYVIEEKYNCDLIFYLKLVKYVFTE